MNKAIFMDRDGVINKLPPKYPNEGIGDIRNYVTKWEDFEFLPGAIEAFCLMESTNYLPIVVSNQGGLIGRKINDKEWYKPVSDIFKQMQDEIWEQTSLHTPSYFCPHLITDRCVCIKPSPGLLYQAAIEHDIVLEDSWMIGDSDTDIIAGYNARVKNMVKIGEKLGNNKDMAYLCIVRNISIKPSLLEAVKYIMEVDSGRQN